MLARRSVEHLPRALRPEIIGIWKDDEWAELGIGMLGAEAYFDMDNPILEMAEQECAALAMVGLTNAEIGTRFERSPEFAKDHLEQVYKKIGVTRRAGLLYGCVAADPPIMHITRAISPGLVQFDPVEARIGRGLAQCKSDAQIARTFPIRSAMTEQMVTNCKSRTMPGHASGLAGAQLFAAVTVLGGFFEYLPGPWQEN